MWQQAQKSFIRTVTNSYCNLRAYPTEYANLLFDYYEPFFSLQQNSQNMNFSSTMNSVNSLYKHFLLIFSLSLSPSLSKDFFSLHSLSLSLVADPNQHLLSG